MKHDFNEKLLGGIPIRLDGTSLCMQCDNRIKVVDMEKPCLFGIKKVNLKVRRLGDKFYFSNGKEWNPTKMFLDLLKDGKNFIEIFYNPILEEKT